METRPQQKKFENVNKCKTSELELTHDSTAGIEVICVECASILLKLLTTLEGGREGRKAAPHCPPQKEEP